MSDTKKAIFHVTRENDGTKLQVEGRRIDIITTLAQVMYEDEDVLFMAMDAMLGAVALHMKEDHGIDLIDMLEHNWDEKMREAKKRERTVN